MSTPPLIEGIRLHVQNSAPEMLPLFDIYANEARFGRQWLDDEIKRLRPGDKVLEVGAGMLLLACQLRSEGIDITALEPVAAEFSHFQRLQQLVLEYAGPRGISPAVLAIAGEELAEDNRFTLVYSINVMEHVRDVQAVLRRAYAALQPGGAYRFLCPNYTFPYEPHFGIPTLGGKKWSGRLMRRRIERFQNPMVSDPVALWASLNWITVAEVRKLCHNDLHVRPKFDVCILSTYIERAIHDAAFQARHSPAICHVLRRLDALGFFACLRWVPARLMPVMDCRITRP